MLVLIGLVALVPVYGAVYAMRPELVDARYRACKRLYAELEQGMTREEVWASVERINPADGARQRPLVMEDSDTVLGFFMHAEGGREPNCEGIFLEFEDGVVVKLEYSRD